MSLGISLFVRDDADDVFTDLLSHLKTDPSSSVRIRTGLVLPLTENKRSATMSTRTGKAGRTLSSSVEQGDFMREDTMLSAVWRSSTLRYGESFPSTKSVLMEYLWCVSVAPLDDHQIEALMADNALVDRAEAIVEFDLSQPLATAYLWSHLSLRAMLHNSVQFNAYEDAPLDYLGTDEHPEFVIDGNVNRPKANDVLFDQVFRGLIALEQGKGDFPYPADPAPAQDGEPIYLRAPAVEAIQWVGAYRSVRTNALDEFTSTAQVAPPPIGLRFPDVIANEGKIRDYCLNPRHESRKWEGFAAAGYYLANPQAVTRLSGIFCSSLVGGFPVSGVGTISNGDLKFEVQVALPTTTGFMPFVSSWQTSETTRPKLVTAFAGGDSSLPQASSKPYPKSALVDDVALFDYVMGWSETVAQLYETNGLSASAVVWVRRDDDRSCAFADTVRRARSGDVGTSTRRSTVIGRATPISLSARDASALEARMHAVQALLATQGIRSHVELIWD